MHTQTHVVHTTNALRAHTSISAWISRQVGKSRSSGPMSWIRGEGATKGSYVGCLLEACDVSGHVPLRVGASEQTYWVAILRTFLCRVFGSCVHDYPVLQNAIPESMGRHE